MELERRFGERPALAEPVDETAGVRISRHARGHRLAPVRIRFAPVKPSRSKIGGGETRRRRMRGVQRLRIGGIAQEFPQTRRLRSRRAKGVQHLIGDEAQAACRPPPPAASEPAVPVV